MTKIAPLLFITGIFILGFTAPAMAGNGVVTVKSSNSVKKTIDILESTLKKKGIGIIARLDHRANGARVNEDLRPTTILVFGNPRLGTPLMRENQTIGIDLPMKALAWEDEKGDVWLSYNDPAYLAKRHNIKNNDPIIKKMSGALAKFTAIATAPQ
ncbi:protein of unknown function DUF302 [hydrothermal vent metagenome]|uniref:DUF302 domain-containing protein n=1 Tax=hydrothermal vent metagenome TaxID=652676 RepID=A0A3B1CDD0_9ZZZZ